MRICIDLDGTICKLKKEDELYTQAEPYADAINAIRKLKSQGHYIIIYTARRMRTHGGNIGLVTADIAAITIKWLTDNDVQYDEIHFGKPYANVYIDDLAIECKNNWDEICQKISES